MRVLCIAFDENFFDYALSNFEKRSLFNYINGNKIQLDIRSLFLVQRFHQFSTWHKTKNHLFNVFCFWWSIVMSPGLYYYNSYLHTVNGRDRKLPIWEFTYHMAFVSIHFLPFNRNFVDLLLPNRVDKGKSFYENSKLIGPI